MPEYKLKHQFKNALLNDAKGREYVAKQCGYSTYTIAAHLRNDNPLLLIPGSLVAMKEYFGLLEVSELIEEVGEPIMGE